MKREAEQQYHDRAARDFDLHVTTIGPGYSWRFQRPGSFNYYFRVTWAPGVLVVSGDIGELVLRHYSFDDPWSAAAWINGAAFDYFMEKSTEKKEYAPETTASGIVEDAYRQLRDGLEYDCSTRTIPKIMDEIVERYGEWRDDPKNAEHRKYACREMLLHAESREFEARDAYEMTGDAESICMDYADGFGHRYMACKKWGAWMWANEPAWHIVLRHWRRLKEIRKTYHSYPIIWDPVRYVEYRGGKPSAHNGHRFWRWQKHSGRDGDLYVYHALQPWLLFGRDMTRFGFWRDQGSRTSDHGGMDGWGKPLRPGDGFRDVRDA